MAWLVALPCAAFAVVAVWLLGPALEDLLTPNQLPLHFWTGAWLAEGPVKQAPYVVGLVALLPLVLATAVAMRRPRRQSTQLAAVATAAQLLMLLLLAFCLNGQFDVSFERPAFTPATLVASGVIAAAIAAGARNRQMRKRMRAWMRDTPGRRIAGLGLAVAFTVVWLLHVLQTDRSVAWSYQPVGFHVAFPLDEVFAVLNGLTPLVDFTAQYGSLWPLLTAPAMLVLGKTLLAFTLVMATITALALLGVYDILRRVTRSPLAALLLFLPFVATSFFLVRGTMTDRLTFGAYFGMFPLRFAGPFLLAWLTARRLDRGSETAAWPLFLAAGLVVLNNLDFGFAALAATLAALLWTTQDRSRGAMLRLAANVAIGLAGALAAVSAVTLIRAGALPQLGRLTEYGRIFGIGRYNARSLASVIGIPLIVYGTYVAAIGTATVRALRGADNPALTGMLVWIGVFGLGAADYYVLRAFADTQPTLFPPWALALALLTVVALPKLAASPLHANIPSIAVLFGLGLTICSIPQTPVPWTQLQRLSAKPHDKADALGGVTPLLPSQDPRVRNFIASVPNGSNGFVVKHGAAVAIFATTGHRMADAYGIVDVVPYTGWASVVTVEQLESSLDALRAAGGVTAIVPLEVPPAFLGVLADRGFHVLTRSGVQPWRAASEGQTLPNDAVEVDRMSKWVDVGPRTS